MSATDQAGRIAPYLNRLLSDDYVQNQIRQLLADLRQGSRRAKRKGAKKAGSDKRVRRHFAAAATAAGQLARALREPEPPKRHPIRRVLGVVAVAGAGAAIYRQRKSKTPGTEPRRQ